MRATVVHNPRAGRAESSAVLMERFDRIGWKVVQWVTESEDCLGHGSDVIVVAGGDGTIGRIARRVAGTDVPLAIVPLGTANNVARSLGVGLDAERAVAGLERAEERRVDVGVITTRQSGETELFLEGFGMGIFAYVIGEKEQTTKRKKKIDHAVDFLADELERYQPRRYALEVGGRDVSGSYDLVAVMNMRHLGPALSLAPKARWDDGELDVVLVPPEARTELVRHLRRRAEASGDGEESATDSVAMPGFEVIRARQVRVAGDGRWTHADDRPRELHGDVTVGVAGGALRVLVPVLSGEDQPRRNGT
jgi:diacylglycerol kinase family enzyme